MGQTVMGLTDEVCLKEIFCFFSEFGVSDSKNAVRRGTSHQTLLASGHHLLLSNVCILLRELKDEARNYIVVVAHKDVSRVILLVL